MYANNEIGSIQPIRQNWQKSRIGRTGAVSYRCCAGIRADPDSWSKKIGIDLLSASGHKFNGPKGTGFLYARQGLKLQPMIHGGGQERKMRAGTENVPGIVGIGRGGASVPLQILEKKMRI